MLINLFLFLVVVVALGWALYSNWSKIREVLSKPIDYRYFGLGMVIYMTALMITFARWHQLVQAQGMSFALRDAFRLGFIGNVFNLVIPGAVGGDVIKAAFLGRMQPDKKPQAWASMVLDRVLGLLGLFLLAGAAGAVAFPTASPKVRILIGSVWGLLVAGFLVLGVAFSPGLYRPLNKLVAGRGRLEGAVRKVEAIGMAYRRRIGLVVGMLGVAVVSHALFVLAFYTASLAIFPNLPTLGQHYLMVPLVLFSTAVPVPFGALGVVENVSDILFQMVNHKEGAIAMMAFRILMYGSAVISALVYVANLRQVRTLAQAPPVDLDLSDGMDQTIVDPRFSGEGPGPLRRWDCGFEI